MPGTIWTKTKEHVPTRHVARAVEDKLRDVSDIAAPGMPRGRVLFDAVQREIYPYGIPISFTAMSGAYFWSCKGREDRSVSKPSAFAHGMVPGRNRFDTWTRL